jgi:ribosomal protein L11 methyltransferase
MHHLALRVRGAAAAAAAADILDELTGGVAAFEVDEAAEEWTVEAYPPTSLLDPALDLRLRLVAAAAGGDILALSEERLTERDWLAENRRAFPPQRIGRFFIHGSHWRGRPPPGAIAIEIDAATAFGTGEHQSTRGCLLAFDRLAKARRFGRLRDVGTGSGILAIAVARTLRKRVTASDIDAESVRVACHHARRNGVVSRVRVVRRAGVGDAPRRYDLVFANILARPLALMARDLGRSVAPGGVAVLSGLLRRQEAGVLSAYRGQRLRLQARLVIDGWSTLVVRRRS